MFWSPILCIGILGTWVSITSASGLPTSRFCFRGCQLALQEFQFNDTDANAKGFTRSCRSRLKSISLFLCVNEYCELSTQTPGLEEYNQTCRNRAQSSLPPLIVIADFTEDDIAKIRRVEGGETYGKGFSELLLPSRKLFRLAFDTIDVAFWEGRIHVHYGFAMLYFWIAVVSVGMFTKLWSLMEHIRRGSWIPLPDGEQGRINLGSKGGGFLGLPSLCIKRYLTVPATFGYRCSQNVKWCTVPSRIQSLAISAFTVMNVVLCLINYRTFEGNMYWPDTFTQYCRYFSDRTGIISYANFPLIWLFGTRNNVLLWLTGWDFGAYSNFHRWIARVSTAEAIAHSIGYTVMVLERGDWALFWNYWTRRWWWAGELATIFMVAICVFSVYGLRRHYYEVFLYTHIVLSVVVLVTMFWHVEIFLGTYNAPIWICSIIWILDRLLRMYRVLSFNPKFWDVRATTTYDPKSNIVRMVIPSSRSFHKPRPGTYYYLYVLNDFRIWESHPFTLAYPSQGQDGTTLSAWKSSPPTEETDSSRLEVSSTSSDESQQLLPASDNFESFTFLIRPYDGFTSRLRAAALHQPAKLRVLVEGPYGDTHQFQKFDSILFVVGGTGIATPLSYLAKLLSRNSSTTSVHIIWAVREHSFLADVVQTDLEPHLPNEKLSITAYVTQHPEDITRLADPAHDLLTKPWPSKGVHVLSGRPAVHKIVQEAAKSAGHGRLAVVACGPAQMADDTRKAVVDVLALGHEKIEYFEESYKW